MDTPFIGTIIAFAGNFAPPGWKLCDGETLAINQNQALFTILGTQYGGDGDRNFQLPNLTPMKEVDGGETPIRYIIALQGIYPHRN